MYLNFFVGSYENGIQNLQIWKVSKRLLHKGFIEYIPGFKSFITKGKSLHFGPEATLKGKPGEEKKSLNDFSGAHIRKIPTINS